MLRYLQIQNYALIDRLSLEFEDGLNVLTGETGAGKSIIIGAINLLLGERASVEMIREGEEKAQIEGLFTSLPEDLQTFLEREGLTEEELILAREIFRSGRNICRVNGRAVTVSFLKKLGGYLLDIHGQHQHQSILRSENQLKLVDNFGDHALEAAKKKTAQYYKQITVLERKKKRYGGDPDERRRKIGLLDYQINEIKRAGLTLEEEEELHRRKRVLQNAEKIFLTLSEAYKEMYGEGGDFGSLVDRVQEITTRLEKLCHLEPGLKQPLELLQGSGSQMSEAARDLRNYMDTLRFEPAELEQIENRISLIIDLKRKYGGSISAILQYLKEAQVELEGLQSSDRDLEELEGQLDKLKTEYRNAAAELGRARKKTAAVLTQKILGVLKELALPRANLAIEVKEIPGAFSASGNNEVEFLFTANPGEPLKPLSKIASGGEMARVMLAFKSVLAAQDKIPTLIFDEVDSGIGGVTVVTVAKKLASLGKSHQVICVTHSPQIGAMGDNHLFLYKQTKHNRTLIESRRLRTLKERETEIARMLDGRQGDELSQLHARALLKKRGAVNKGTESI